MLHPWLYNLTGPNLAGTLLPITASPTQNFLDKPGSHEGNTEGPGTASSEPLLPS